jgi:hypothetical protein
MSEEIKQAVAENLEAQQPIPETSPVTENKDRIARENFKKLQIALQEAEERAAAAERKAQEQQQYRESNNVPVNQEEEEALGDPDDYVYNKNLQRTTKKIKGELSETKAALQELQQRLEISEAKSEINALKDFDEVVSKDNIKTFARLYPDEYATIMASPNLRTRSKLAYNMIKNYGIAEASPLLRQTEEIRMAEKKIEANKLKPSPSSSAPVSQSPLTKFGRYDTDGRLVMTEEDAKRIQAEVRRKLGN